jgi:hypothetical protein
MRRVRDAVRSPSLVISIIALVFAVGGTSLASTIGHALGLSGKQRKQVKKIADAEIKHKASGLSVKFAKTATTATTAAKAVAALSSINADDLGGQPASSYGRVFESGIKTVPYTSTAPATVLTFGPFTAQATCLVTNGTLALAFTIAYPAGATVGDAGTLPAGGTFRLDLNSPPLNTQAGTGTIHDTGSLDFSGIGGGLTLLAPDGTAYHLVSAWDAINYLNTGNCAAEAFVVQG